jgi:type I restriction enzyme, S subunit
MTSTALRRVAHLQRGAGFPNELQGSTEGELPFYKVSDFANEGNGRYLYSCSNWISCVTALELRAVPVPAGSVLLPKIGAALLGNARRITTTNTIFDNNILAVVPDRIDSRYLYYWLSTVDLGELANPGPVPSLNDSALLDFHLPSHKLSAQLEIADFLDSETARIDALVAKKRSMIGQLLERRATVTASAITGKFSCGALVPSLLPWLAERPSHWAEVLLRLVAHLGSGHTPSREHPEWWVDCTIPWITTGEVARLRSDQVEYIEETREKISEAGLENSSAELHPANTVVLCRTASAGYSGIMKYPMATSQDFATWTCGPLLRPRFLLLCLRAMRSDLLGRLAMGSTHKTIYMPDIRSIRIPLPPIDEQDEIVSEAWSRFDVIDRAVRSLERQIALLQEHRQALIAATVTGTPHGTAVVCRDQGTARP